MWWGGLCFDVLESIRVYVSYISYKIYESHDILRLCFVDICSIVVVVEIIVWVN